MNNFCLKLPSIAAHRIFDLKNISFSLEHFSEFKHGSELCSKLFAKDLYEKFKESNFMKDLEGKDIRIYSSPYSELATASLHLTKAFIQYLESDKSFIPKSIGHHKIRRIQTYSEDYGALSAVSRYELIKNDTYAFEEIPSPNDYLIFLDDISITGCHQYVIENLLKTNYCKNKCLFLYFAKLENEEIDPSIEKYLNNFKINSVESIFNRIISDDFLNTTRITKRILSFSSVDRETFMQYVGLNNAYSILKVILEDAKRNEYHQMIEYSYNYETLNKLLLN